MKERPILFSAPMVRAIQAGTKTQTRRVVKPVGDDDGFVLQDYGRGWWPYRSDDGESPMKGDNEIPHACPYGQPGERLWVREAWRAPSSCDHLPPRSISDSEAVRFMADETVGADPGFGKGRPGMFMPRWASRITLEVTGVRVERLQDITGNDVMAEGCTFPDATGVSPAQLDARWQAYRDLWESINGPGSWDANPWVWVVEFRRLS